MSTDRDTEVSLKRGFTRVLRQQTGFSESLCSAMAEEAWRRLVHAYRGERIYIAPSKAERDAAVVRDFTGDNHDEVMTRHGISRATLYRLLGERGKARSNET